MNLKKFSTSRVIVSTSRSQALFYAWITPTFNPFNEGGSGSNFLVTNDPRNPLTYLTVDNTLVTLDSAFQLDATTWQVDFTMGNNSPNGIETVTVTAPTNKTFTVNYPGAFFTGVVSVTTVTPVGLTIRKNGVVIAPPFQGNSADTFEFIAALSVANIHLVGAILVSDNSLVYSDGLFTFDRPVNPAPPPATPAPYFNASGGPTVAHQIPYSFFFRPNVDVGDIGIWTGAGTFPNNGPTFLFTVPNP